MENIFIVMYAAILKSVNANVDVKAKLNGELIKTLDQAHLMFYKYIEKNPHVSEEYKKVKELLGFTMIDAIDK